MALGGIYNKDGLSYSPLVVKDDEVIDFAAQQNLTPAKVNKGQIVMAILEAIDPGVRYRLIGEGPTPVLGNNLPQGQQVEVWGTENIKNLRGSGGRVYVAYWGS